MILKNLSGLLNSGVGDGLENEEEDVFKTQKNLNKFGLFDDEPNGILSKSLDSGIKAFQRFSGLKVDGRMKPRGETERSMFEELEGEDSDSIFGKPSNQFTPIGFGQSILKTVTKRPPRSNSLFKQTLNLVSGADETESKQQTFRIKREFKQTLSNSARNSFSKCNTKDFLEHFWFGKGRAKSLSEIGYLTGVIAEARRSIYKNVENQVADLMLRQGEGRLTYDTTNSYSQFDNVKFELGGGTLDTHTKGIVTRDGDYLEIEGSVEYEYFDEFTDPVNLRQLNPNIETSSTEHPAFEENKWTELSGTAYDIKDSWKTEIIGRVLSPQEGDNTKKKLSRLF